MQSFKVIFKRFLISIQFFTQIPIRVNLDISPADTGKSLAMLPIVGLIIGTLLFLFFSLLKIFLPLELCAILTLLFYVILTGGLHIDGLGDTFDGVFSNRPKERILEIMKDSRLGTNGVLAILFICILNTYLIYKIASLDAFYLISFPIAGRISGLVCCSISKYARKEGGLGQNFIEYCSFKELLIGILYYIPLFLLFFPYTDLMVLPLSLTLAAFSAFILCTILFSLAPIIISLILTKYFSKKLDGITGDIVGAVIELSQTLFLILLLIFTSKKI